MRVLKKRGIALLITVLFMLAIIFSLGISLKQVNEVTAEVENENFMLQTSVILDDVLTLLRTSEELDFITKDKSGDAFFIFLSEASFIPFESSGIKVLLELKSARAKFNINAINSEKRIDALKQYFNNYMVNPSYVDMLVDNMSGIKQDMSYHSEIFYEKPYLFRDYIVSRKHLDEISDFYDKTYRDNHLHKKATKDSNYDEYFLNIDDLFYFSSNRSTSVDLNYATVSTWEMMLGCSRQRAIELNAGGGSYDSLETLMLDDEERIELAKFQTSFFEPYLDVSVEVLQNNNSAIIRFEYDMKSKKGSNFVYEI